MNRRALLLGATASLGVRRAAAQDAYPNRPLKLIVPFDLGTRVGLTAYLLRPHLELAVRQRIDLLPEPGADGELGHLLGAEADADGYTLTLVSQSLAVQHWLSNASTTTPENFAFVGQITAIPNLLLVRADSPFRSLADLVAALRAEPDALRTGGQPNWWPASAITRALFAVRAGVQPRIDEGYYSASGLLWALEAGQLDFVVVGLSDLRGTPASRRMRALAVSSEQRVSATPDTPTFREQGYDIVTAWWHGLATPTDTAASILATLRTALSTTLASSALRSDFARNGLTVDPLSGTAMRTRVIDEYQMIGELFTRLGKNVRVHRPI